MTFPKSTIVNKIMPKEVFYKNLTLPPELKNAFVSDIKRIIWKNKLSADTLNIDKGETVTEILVLQIELKVKNYNPKILETVSKNNAHHILYIMTFESKTQIAFFHNKLYKTEWKDGAFDMEIKGLDMNAVWENIVKSVEGGKWSEELSFEENLQRSDRKQKLEVEIEKLEKQARSEKQPNKKFRLAQQAKALKKELEDL